VTYRSKRKTGVPEKRERQCGSAPDAPETGADRLLDLAEVVRAEVRSLRKIT